MPLPVSSNALATGLSGMRAAQRQLDTSAHNIANAQTPHFQRQVVHQTAQPGSGGVQVQIGREAEAAAAQGGDLAHLAEDLLAQRMSANHFAASLRTVQTQDRMLGSLLDTEA